ncbi:hypothetical protein BC830DRAFT_920148 [Chytriomyces sp. MP71]|nr:hypothetical protein BC830DRAFT_920148 [Chytriomyces sp. MP71]
MSDNDWASSSAGGCVQVWARVTTPAVLLSKEVVPDGQMPVVSLLVAQHSHSPKFHFSSRLSYRPCLPLNMLSFFSQTLASVEGGKGTANQRFANNEHKIPENAIATYQQKHTNTLSRKSQSPKQVPLRYKPSPRLFYPHANRLLLTASTKGGVCFLLYPNILLTLCAPYRPPHAAHSSTPCTTFPTSRTTRCAGRTATTPTPHAAVSTAVSHI